MYNFKEKYKQFYDNIVYDKNKKSVILNTVKNKQNKHILVKNNKFAYIFTIILLVGLIGTGFAFAKTIKSLKRYFIDNKIFNCIIQAPVVNVLNSKFDLKENEEIARENLQDNLGINILSSSYLPNSLFVNKIVYDNSDIAYINLSQSLKNNIIENSASSSVFFNSTIDLNISFFTNHANSEIKEDNIDLAFKDSKCSKDNVEIIYNEHLKTNIYFVKATTYAYDDIEFVIYSYFTYNDILYSIRGSLVSRDNIIDFINSLNY